MLCCLFSEPVPHTYVIVGGGEWGPRVVARTVLESVYVDWVSDVYLLDMKDAKSYLDQDGGLEQVRTGVNTGVYMCIDERRFKTGEKQ